MDASVFFVVESVWLARKQKLPGSCDAVACSNRVWRELSPWNDFQTAALALASLARFLAAAAKLSSPMQENTWELPQVSPCGVRCSGSGAEPWSATGGLPTGVRRWPMSGARARRESLARAWSV